jgi:hypothetical protein
MSFFSKIGDLFKKLWDALSKILVYLLIVIAVVLLVFAVLCTGGMAFTVFGVAFTLTSTAAYALAALAITAAFLIDPERAAQIVGSIGEAAADAAGAVAEALANIAGEVGGGVLSGLFSSPFGIVLLGIGGYLLYKWFTGNEDDKPIVLENGDILEPGTDDHSKELERRNEEKEANIASVS